MSSTAEGTILWRSRVDGSERLQLTQPPLRSCCRGGRRMARGSPSWDGHQDGPGRFTSLPAEGGEPQPILEGDRAEADPDWAPDGESLMFGRPPDYLAESSVPKAIHLLDLKTQRSFRRCPAPRACSGPAWSPSGRYVAAMTLDQARLLLFDFSTQAWTELGRFKTVHNPVWSRDERFLYFEVVDEASIYRARLSDRAVERVARPGRCLEVSVRGLHLRGSGAGRLSSHFVSPLRPRRLRSGLGDAVMAG